MVVVTGASGQLGRLVIEELLKKLPAGQIVAAVRNPAKVADLAARGVQVREADYVRPETLLNAFQGADKLLLISSSEVGQRLVQHRNAIEAAKQANVGLIAYTSVLRADRSSLALAAEHVATEKLLAESGVPYVLLRNGWYTENYLYSVAPALQHGAYIGSAGEGRISSAARADYAAAAAAVLNLPDQAGKIYELAGDEAYTLADLAAEITRQTGKTVIYNDLPEQAYKAALQAAGFPEPLAGLLANSDVGVSKGELYSEERQLSRLIGRPTTPMPVSLKAALTA